MCVCLYDLAMPICIILDPLNWTRPDLIHIEGDRDRHHARDPACPAGEEAGEEGCSPVLDERAPPPLGARLATKGGPCRARIARALGGVGRGVQLGPRVCFYQSQPLDKDSSQSLEVQRLPHTSEPCPHQEREAARLLVQAFFILFRSMFIDSLSQNQALLLSHYSVCKQFSYVCIL